jgi:hypothetical protein
MVKRCIMPAEVGIQAGRRGRHPGSRRHDEARSGRKRSVIMIRGLAIYPHALAKMIRFVLALFLGSTVMPAVAMDFSLVINNGRVIDPETELDAVRHLGIRDDTIVAVSEKPLSGQTVIDATGLVVSPGFIDLHTHSPTPLGQHYQAFDGVTTALELEAGYYPVLKYGSDIQDQLLINYGASAGHVGARLLEKNGMQMPSGLGRPSPVGVKGWMTAITFLIAGADVALKDSLREVASEEELKTLRGMLEESLDQGALGIGLALDYFSEAIQGAEMRMIFSLAAERKAPIFVHLRRGIDGDPSGLREVRIRRLCSCLPCHPQRDQRTGTVPARDPRGARRRCGCHH